jgi:hypothetical protein
MERKGTDYKINIRTPMGAALFSIFRVLDPNFPCTLLVFPAKFFCFFFFNYNYLVLPSI